MKEKNCFLVDTGGGNGILKQLKSAGLSYRNISEIFITHKHIDHLLGIFWLLRQFASGKDEFMVTVISHKEVIDIICNQTDVLFNDKQKERINNRVIFKTVDDGEKMNIIDHEVTFFNTHSTEVTQFGFCMKLSEDRKLTCLGDVPYNDSEWEYAYKSDWLLHEDFCISQDYHGYHATVKQTAENAEKLKVANLLIYHTEESNLKERKERYSKEAGKYYHGNIHVPDDLDTI